MSVSSNPNPSNQEETEELNNKRDFINRASSYSSPFPEIGICHQSSQSKRCRLIDQEITPENLTSSVVIQAEELRSKLDPKFPSFIKTLASSHVTGGFWMGLPAPFCQKHLPQKDDLITLETESKKLYTAKYIVNKTGLSCGWKEFAISERLSVGDVVVFHLVSATKFKVYIIKENNFTEVGGAPFLLNLDTLEEQTELDMLTGTSKGKDFPEVDQSIIAPPENSGSTSTETSSKTAHAFPIVYKEAVALSPDEVSTFDNFCLVIDELLKDYELPRHIKWSYYKLCCSQNAMLHDNLPKWMNHIMVGGILIETVTIADALRQCDLSTSKEEFSIWDKTLNALELLGMSIGFLRGRLHHLQRIVFDSEAASFRQKHAELCSENARTEDEIRSLMARLAELKKIHSKRAVDIEIVKSKIKSHELEFQELVRAPW